MRAEFQRSKESAAAAVIASEFEGAAAAGRGTGSSCCNAPSTKPSATAPATASATARLDCGGVELGTLLGVPGNKNGRLLSSIASKNDAPVCWNRELLRRRLRALDSRVTLGGVFSSETDMGAEGSVGDAWAGCFGRDGLRSGAGGIRR